MHWKARTKRLSLWVFASAVLLLGWGVSLQLAIWAADRGPATQVYGREIRTPKVRPGSDYSHVNDFQRMKFCAADVYRWLTLSNGKHRDLETLHNALSTTGGLGVRQFTEARINIPADVPEGATDLGFRPVWYCNPLHAIWPIYGPEEHVAFIVDKAAPPSPPPMKKK